MMVRPLKAKYQCTLLECYPKTVAEVGFNAAQGEVARLNVSMAYRKWVDTTQDEGLGTVGSNPVIAGVKSYDPSTGTFSSNSISGGNITLPSGEPLILT